MSLAQAQGFSPLHTVGPAGLIQALAAYHTIETIIIHHAVKGVEEVASARTERLCPKDDCALDHALTRNKTLNCIPEREVGLTKFCDKQMKDVAPERA